MTFSSPLRGLPVVAGACAALLVAAAVPAADPPQGTAAAPAAASPATAPAPGTKAHHSGGKADTAAASRATTSYSLGLSMGEQLRASSVTSAQINTERLAQGVRDALSGKTKMTQADQENIVALLRGAQESVGETNHRAAAHFLEENGRKPGITTTASGLQYKVLSDGHGDSPKASDEVTVNYRGTLLDGTEFDSSYKRGEPASFHVDRVIPGWTEALGLMKPGAKWQLFIPPHLAYDMHSRPPIPPGSMLIFEVELLSIKPNAATPPAAPPAAAPASTPPKK